MRSHGLGWGATASTRTPVDVALAWFVVDLVARLSLDTGHDPRWFDAPLPVLALLILTH